MPQQLANELRETVDREAASMKALSPEATGRKPGPAVWSQKEELGHLIDSAANNHIRFVRASIEPEFRGPGYAQDDWVAAHGYNERPWGELIEFWQRYNYFLADLVARIPEERLAVQCFIGKNAPVTLAFVIEDYTLHMQHHLDHILRREKITS